MKSSFIKGEFLKKSPSPRTRPLRYFGSEQSLRLGSAPHGHSACVTNLCSLSKNPWITSIVLHDRRLLTSPSLSHSNVNNFNRWNPKSSSAIIIHRLGCFDVISSSTYSTHLHTNNQLRSSRQIVNPTLIFSSAITDLGNLSETKIADFTFANAHS